MTTTSDMVTAAAGGSTSSLLIGLTNQEGASAINTTVLNMAASMAEGDFRVLVGIEPNADTDFHKGPLYLGTIYYLESFKSRDMALVSERRNAFRYACANIRDKAAFAPSGNSPLAANTERTGAKADLDRNGVIGGLTAGFAPNVTPAGARSPFADPDVQT